MQFYSLILWEILVRDTSYTFALEVDDSDTTLHPLGNY
jgi:hypothetical protein